MTSREDPYVNFLNDIERIAEKYGYNIDSSCNYRDGDEKYPRVEITFVNHAIAEGGKEVMSGYKVTGGNGVYIDNPAYNRKGMCHDCPYKTDTCQEVLHCEKEEKMNDLNHTCYTLSRNSHRCDVCGAPLPNSL